MQDLALHFNVKTDKDLADKLGVSPQRLNHWKKSNKFDIQDIMPILLKENIDLNWLLGANSQKNVLKEPEVEYEAVGASDLVMKLAKTENEVTRLRMEILNLHEELKKTDSEINIDNRASAALNIEMDKLRADKIKAEAERDILLDIVKSVIPKSS